MPLLIGRGHIEALESSDERVKLLVREPFSSDSLKAFVQEYDGPNIDARALFPILNVLEGEFAKFNEKYELEGFLCEAFLAKQTDASKLTCYLEFFTFISQRLRSRGQYELFTWFIQIQPLKYVLAANLDISTAALALLILNGDCFEYKEESKYCQYFRLSRKLEMFGFIPTYSTSETKESNYSLYLNRSCGVLEQSPICLGSFKLEASEIENYTTMEIIEMGMKEISREMWPELIYLARKAVSGRRFNGVERLQLVGLHILQLLQYETLCSSYGIPQLNYTTPPYIEVPNYNILCNFPQLGKFMCSILTRRDPGNCPKKIIHDRLHLEELYISALKGNNAELMEAIISFYEAPSSPWKLITPMSAFVIMQSLKVLNDNHSKLPVQVAILKTLKQTIKDKDVSFMSGDQFVPTIQSLVLMVANQLNYHSYQDDEVTKGLLVIINMMLDYSGTESSTLANDSTTLVTLSQAARHKKFQLISTKCLCSLLSAEISCYSLVSESNLWDDFLSAGGVFALAWLYSSLTTTDAGKGIISTYKLRETLTNSILENTFEGSSISERLYASISDAVTADKDTLDCFGESVQGYLRRVLDTLDAGPDESSYGIQGDIWCQHSHIAQMVDHVLLLLSSLVHRDEIRKQLENHEVFGVLMDIFSHVHLPWVYTYNLYNKSQFKHILNELFVVQNSESMVENLFCGLVDTLRRDLNDYSVLQKLILCSQALRSLQIKRGNDLSKHITLKILSNPNFQQLATLLPESISLLQGLQYDFMSGSQHELVGYIMSGGRGRFFYSEDSKMFQLQQINGIQRLGVSLEDYNTVKAQVIPIIFAKIVSKSFMKFTEDLVSSAVRARLTFPEGYSPDQFARGIITVHRATQLRTTRDRFIFTECGFFSSLGQGWHQACFVRYGGVETLMDLWVDLHASTELSDYIMYETFISTNYLDLVKSYLEKCFSKLGIYLYDWNTFTAIDPSFSERVYAEKCMNFRIYIIQKLSQYRTPISEAFHNCWWEDNCDPLRHISQRDYVLKNINGLFQNQDSTSIRHVIYIVMKIFKTFEYQRPILNELIPKLLDNLCLSSVALLSGIYSDSGLRYKVLKLSYSEVNRLFGVVFSVPDPLVILCTCQVLSNMPYEILCQVGQKTPLVPKLATLLMSITDSRAILSVLELTTICCITDKFTSDLATLKQKVNEHCLGVFEKEDFNGDSIMAYSNLMDFNKAAIETDESVLESSMAFFIAEKCSMNGMDPKLLEVKLAGYAGRSKSCFEAALRRYFVQNTGFDIVLPRAALSYASSFVPPVLEGQLPTMSHFGMEYIDTVLAGCITKSSIAEEAAKHLMQCRILSEEFYSQLGANIHLNHKAARIDSETAGAWNSYRRAILELKLHMDVLNYVTLSYGAPVEYIMGHHLLWRVLKAVTLLAGTVSLHSGAHRYVLGFRQCPIDELFRFIKSLYTCSPAVSTRTVGLLSEILESAPESERITLSQGILYFGAPSFYCEYFLKSLDSSGILDTCAQVLGLGEKGSEYSINGPEPHYCRYYRSLTTSYREYQEKHLEFTSSQNEDTTPLVSVEVSNESGGIAIERSVETVGREDDTGLVEAGNIQSDYDSSADFSNSDQELSESEYEYPDSDYEEDVQGIMPVFGAFDFEEFSEYCPLEMQFNSWTFDTPSGTMHTATETLHSSFTCPIDDETILFYEDVSPAHLTSRDINIAPVYAPEDDRYTLLPRAYEVRPPITWYKTYFCHYGKDDSCDAHLQVLFKYWKGCRDYTPINWSNIPVYNPGVPCISNAWLPVTCNRPDMPIPPSNTQNCDQCSVPTKSEITYESAVYNASQLLGHSDELRSWGLDPNYLETLPDDLQLESIISYLTLKSGDEMTASEIRATIDDGLYFETCMGAIQSSEVGLQGYLKSNIFAQLPKPKGSTLWSNLRFSKEPYPTVISAKTSFRCGVLLPSLSFDYQKYIPTFKQAKTIENEVLAIFRDKLVNHDAELCMKPLQHFTNYFFEALSGTLNLELIIEVMATHEVLCQRTSLSKVLTILQETARDGKVYPLADEFTNKILSVYLSDMISSKSQRFLKKSISVLVFRGYLNSDTLQKELCSRILRQIDDCIESIACNHFSNDAFSKLESTLSSLTRNPLCSLSKGNEEIVDKAILLSSNVSEILADGPDNPSNIRLLRCYLLLVTLTPSARPAFVSFVGKNREFVNRVITQDPSILKSCVVNLVGHYDLLSSDVRIDMIRNKFPQKFNESISVQIKRENIFSNSYTQVMKLPALSLLHSTFKVIFDGELGFDGGGLTREWLTTLSRDLSNPSYGLFNKISRSENDFIVHPNPQSLYDSTNLRMYEFVGKMMAKAVLLKQNFDCSFSLVIYEHIVSKSPCKYTLEELYLFDSDLAKGLSWILDNDIADVLMETFTIKSYAFGKVQLEDLKPGGRNIAVTEENKYEYVALMIKQTMFTCVEKQIMAICTGFWSLIPFDLAKLLQPSELEKILCGGQLNIEEWKSITIYQGFSVSSLPVKYFWQAITSMSDSERRKVLLFATGSDKVPIFASTGSNRKPFTISKLYKPSFSGVLLPTASTCMSVLHLPDYSSHEEALISLRKAVDLGAMGFGFA